MTTRIARETFVGAGTDEASAMRRAYLAYFAVVIAGVLVLEFSLPRLDPVIAQVAEAIVPPTLLFFVTCALTLLLRPRLLRVIEIVQYLGHYPILLVFLSVMLASSASETVRLRAIASFAVWVPFVIVWAFIVFGSRRGPVAALTFLAATAAVVTGHHLGPAVFGGHDWVLIVQLSVASTALIVILYALARLLEAHAERRAVAETAATYAIRDALTGAFTRFAFDLRFEQALAVARRGARSLAVLFLDVDDFKRVNDDLGHAAGDELLREVARRIQASVREADTVARIGGDEFVVLAFVSGVDQAHDLAARLVTVGDEPVVCNGLEVHVALSVGVSLHPDDAVTRDALLAAADAAMYAAKAQGKRRWARAPSAPPAPS